MVISDFAITGYVNADRPSVFSGSVIGLSCWYEGLSGWVELGEVPPTLPLNTELHLLVSWLNQSPEPISGHVRLAVTRPDGTEATLNDVLNQNIWAAPGNGWMVEFELVTLSQAGTYRAKATLSTMGETLAELSVDVATVVNTVGDFRYEVLAASTRSCPVATAWKEPVYTCRIRNAGAPGERTVTFVFEQVTGTVTPSMYQESFHVYLGAGEYFNYTFVNALPGPGGYVKVLIGGDGRARIHLEDDAGGRSPDALLPY
jgi:hypothetical protein